MNQEIALELLKIAASLTEAAMASKTKTANSPQLMTFELAFKDCLGLVVASFNALSAHKLP